MIVVAEQDHLKRIAELGPKFWKESKLPGEFIPEVFVSNWTKIIEKDQGVIFANISENSNINGAIGLLLYNDINDGKLIMQEAFWFVDESSRGFGVRLLKKAEKLAESIGVKRFVMTHVLNQYADKLSKLYPKMGFIPLEINYIKNL